MGAIKGSPLGQGVMVLTSEEIAAGSDPGDSQGIDGVELVPSDRQLLVNKTTGAIAVGDGHTPGGSLTPIPAAGSSAYAGWIYGDGSDGAHVCVDGETLATGNYTDFTIPEGVTVHVEFARQYQFPQIFCTGTFTIDGTVDLSGADAVGMTCPDSFGNSGNTDVGIDADAGLFLQAGGGSGGAGVGGVPTDTSNNNFREAQLIRSPFVFAKTFPVFAEATPGPVVSSAAIAGSGAGDSTFNGGAGGGQGGYFAIIAKTIAHGDNNLYNLQGGKGGDGGDDGTGATGNGDCGGGGGGSMGWWITLADTMVGEANISGAGGLGGAGCGSGTDGQDAPSDGLGIHLLNKSA